MKILHLAAGNRWTGAAAVAFAEVEALRAAGVDAHYAFVGGYKLEEKLAALDYAHPLIEKKQDPMSFRRTLQALGAITAKYGFDYLHAHLTYDHMLARLVTRKRSARLARTFHSRRTLRSDPYTRWLLRRTGKLFAVNDTFLDASALRGRPIVYTPPPLDMRQFKPEGPNVRSLYGVRTDERLVVMIGKVSRGRGFEEGLQAFSILRRLVSRVRLMIIGHGPERGRLEALARALGIDDALIWAGYHEDDLAEHLRAGDAFFFTAPGSDEGHRAVLEVMACGVVPLSYPVAGVHALFGALAEHLVTAGATPAELAQRTAEVLESGIDPMRAAALAQAQAFTYARASQRLLGAYGA